QKQEAGFKVWASAGGIRANERCDMEVYNLSGKLLYKKMDTEYVPTLSLAPGIYLVKVVNRQGEGQLVHFAR
ncbi:MAG: T9SS type A sorting domain-containing protein, partial [Candidatus Azobacteroides sp.]|nr:T9SS type A sorting domain-containing protein [Candidatus Azobacteroides sp.]